MVHLTYVENPFEKNIFEKIMNFYEEKSFYDCINRKFIYEPFKNLQYTFHMYLLIGDSNDWIGYVLFSNENKVDFVRNNSIQFIKEKIINISSNPNKYLNILDQNIMSPNLFDIISEIIDELKKELTLEEINNLENEYKSIIENSLASYLNYYNLDIVICLEKNEKTTLKLENKDSTNSIDELVEKKYYGFIQETFKLVEEEIKKFYNDSYIVLRNDDYTEVEIKPSTLTKKIG